MGLEHVPLMGGAMPDAKDQSHHAPQRPIQVYQLDGNILVPCFPTCLLGLGRTPIPEK